MNPWSVRGISRTLQVLTVIVIVAVAGVGVALFYPSQPAANISTTATSATSVSGLQISDPALVLQAVQEGTVTIYNCLNVPTMNAVVSAFNKTYPRIKVQFIRLGASQMFDKVQLELQAGKPGYDVVLNCEMGVMQLLEQIGAFQKYVSPQASHYASDLPLVAGVPIYGSDVVGILYNNKSLSASAAPTSLQGLLNPAFAGKFVMPDPAQHSGTTVWLYNLQPLFPSTDAWQAWIQGLAALRPNLQVSFDPATTVIGTGQAVIGISLVKHIIAHAPDPLSYVNTGTFLTGPDAMAVGAKPQHPAAAKVFVDFVLSQAGQQVLTTIGGQSSTYPGVSPPIPGAANWKLIYETSLNSTLLTKWGQTFHQWVTQGK